MSFSTCIICENIVTSYEALCPKCEKELLLNDKFYHTKTLEEQHEFNQLIGLDDNGKFSKKLK